MRLPIAALVLATALALPSAVSAATMDRNGAILTFVAHPGERNGVNVEAATSTTLIVTDAGAPLRIAAGSGCVELDPEAPGSGAQCSTPAGTTLAVILGDADDRYVAEDGVALPEVVGGLEGDDRIEAGDGSGALGGGPGDDMLDGGGGNDTLRGDDGADLLRGSGGADDLDGGAGDDRVDARTGSGRDLVRCAAGGDDAIVRGPRDTLEGCGGTPRVSLRVPRQRIGSFFDDDGFDFRVRCAEPCAVKWEIVARDRSTRRRIHQRDRRLDRARLRLDADGFPRYLPAGTNELHARPIGPTTRRDIRAARLLRLRLVVTVVGRNSLERTFTRNLTLRR